MDSDEDSGPEGHDEEGEGSHGLPSLLAWWRGQGSMAEGEQGRQAGFWQGMAEQVALSLFATQGLQELALGLGFYPFRRDGHAEGAGQLDYGTAQLAAVLVVGQRLS